MAGNYSKVVSPAPRGGWHELRSRIQEPISTDIGLA